MIVPLDVIMILRDKKIMVFDLDMTLIDARERYFRSMEEIGFPGNTSLKVLSPKDRNRFWNVFLSEKYINYDKPIESTIKYVRVKYREGYGILILTGRPVSMEYLTRKQLKEFNIPYHYIIMRPKGNYDDAVTFKLKVIDSIISYNIEIIELHDDDKELIMEVKERYPWIRTILYKRDNVDTREIGV